MSAQQETQAPKTHREQLMADARQAYLEKVSSPWATLSEINTLYREYVEACELCAELSSPADSPR